MFDIANNRGKVQYQGEMLRLMARMEMVFAKGLAPLLRRQFRLAAEAVASGGGDTDRAVDTVAFPLASYFVDRYKRIAAVFGEEALKRWAATELKKQDTMRTRFWQTLNVWARKEAATQVVKVNKTTKNHIARIVHKGMGEGLSNAEMAKEIRKVGQITANTRARRIARTETHTASVHSINEATKSTGMDFEREWIAALDDRVRRGGKESPWNHVAANGERVGMEEPFKKTGEHLMYPGDPKGSAGNVINCRCVLIYHREKKIVIEPEPEEQVENTQEAIAKRLEKKYKFKDTKVFGGTEEQKLEKLMDLESEVNRMVKQNPGLTEVLKNTKKPVSVNIGGGDEFDKLFAKLTPGADPERIKRFRGAYWPDKRQLLIRIDMSVATPVTEARIGGYTVSSLTQGWTPDWLSTFRHELGHHVHRQGKLVDWKKWNREINKWQRTLPDLIGTVKEGISEYALTNADELFAESFCMFNAPNYAAKDRFGRLIRLPDKLEETFKALKKEVVNYAV